MSVSQTSMCDCDSIPAGLISVDDALTRLLDSVVTVTKTEAIGVAEALGRVLAQPIRSDINVPPLDNSAMDGYAVRSNDVSTDGQTRLPVSQRICAGETGIELESGTAARIFTGAPIPPGADAVIMQERVEQQGDDIVFEGPVTSGMNVRKAGEDITVGDEVLQAGTRLRAQELGLAASVGRQLLEVYRRVRVGTFFTGDELVEPGNPLKPGQIYDSNRYTLLGLFQQMGCQIVDLGVVPDTLEATRTAITQATSEADLVITSGGVSVGEEDHVRIALESLGELDFWRIAVKPGKPLAFGKVNGTPFFGLPGNPVSVFVTFCLFVAPFIKSLQGRRDVLPTPIPVAAGFEWPRPGKRQEFLRARFETDEAGSPCAQIYSHQGSGVLTSTSWADGLVSIPAGVTVQPGDFVEWLSFSDVAS